MDGFIAILVLVMIIEYKIVRNYAYKKGKDDTSFNYKREGYEEGRQKMKEEFYKLLKLPDDEFYDTVEKIRKKLKDEDNTESK